MCEYQVPSATAPSTRSTSSTGATSATRSGPWCRRTRCRSTSAPTTPCTSSTAARSATRSSSRCAGRTRCRSTTARTTRSTSSTAGRSATRCSGRCAQDVPGAAALLHLPPGLPAALSAPSATRSSRPVRPDVPGAAVTSCTYTPSTSSTSASERYTVQRRWAGVPGAGPVHHLPAGVREARPRGAGVALQAGRPEKKVMTTRRARCEPVTTRWSPSGPDGRLEGRARVRSGAGRRTSAGRCRAPGTSTPAPAPVHYCPGPVVSCPVQCPGRTVCRQVWCPRTETKLVPQTTCVPRMETHTAYQTFCRNVPYCTTGQVCCRTPAWCSSSTRRWSRSAAATACRR